MKQQKEQFDKTPYGTKTTDEVLSIVKGLVFRNYEFLKNRPENSQNFFIWKQKDKSNYIRITLISEGWNEKTLFYWNLEISFKPFNYNHNHREGSNIQSEKFKGSETDKYYNYFLNIADNLRGFM